MIALEKEISASPRSHISYQFSKDGRFGWFLILHHSEKDFVLEELHAMLKLEIISSDIQTISKLQVELWQKNFFGDLHWKLHAALRKTNLIEKGISLFFGVLYDHELFFVQFGRLLCVQSNGKSIKSIGNSWQNYLVRSQEKLGLFGAAEADIAVKPQRVLIPEKEKLYVLDATTANKILSSNPDPDALGTLITANAALGDTVCMCLEGRHRLQKLKPRRFNRLQISTLILLLVSILTILYMIFGNRFLDQSFRRMKLMFRENKATSWENIPNYLNLDTSNIIKQIDRIVNLPARNLEFRVAWNTDLPYTITATPVYNIENLFIASERTVLAYNKKSRALIWKQTMPAPIMSMTIARGSLIVILENHQALALRDDGSTIWQQTVENMQTRVGLRFPLELSNEDDPRLDGTVLLLAGERGLSLLDGARGNPLSKIDFSGKLQYLSAYDRFDNCFYAVVADEILCIELKISN